MIIIVFPGDAIACDYLPKIVICDAIAITVESTMKTFYSVDR